MGSLTLPKAPASALTQARDYWSRGLPWARKANLG